MSASTETDRPVRPRNRRDLIAEAAGRAFSERGYHAVGMDDIASAVGITAAALYRHFPNKYALFVHCADGLADGLLGALDELPEDVPLESMLLAVAHTTVVNRATGGIYRWEARYLEPDDRRALRARFVEITDRVAGVVARNRPADLNPTVQGAEDVRLVTVGALGAIGSATAHRTSVGVRRMETLLADSAARVALARLPAADDATRAGHVDDDGRASGRGAPGAVAAAGHGARANRREQILGAAIPLFHRDGYTNVSMGSIASDVGLAPSAIYRHYGSKSDILLAACLEAAERLQEAVDRELVGASSPEDALGALATAYVGYSFSQTELTSVAAAEMNGLPVGVQRPLRAAQRDHLTMWEGQLRAARPDLDTVEARVLVHAALGVVTETGRLLRWRDSPPHRRRVVALALDALGV